MTEIKVITADQDESELAEGQAGERHDQRHADTALPRPRIVELR